MKDAQILPTAPPPVAEHLFGDRLSGVIEYAHLLATTGVDHGLIGPREVPRLWERHIVNCALVAPLLSAAVTLADIGSGAGLPGVTLALARPDIEVHLVEPLARRTIWLEGCVNALALENVTIHRARAENLAGALHVRVVTARAVARLARLAAWAGPLLEPGGELLALKGSSAEKEIDEDAESIRGAGGAEPRIETLGAGDLEIPTTVVRITFPRGGRLPSPAPSWRGSQRAKRVRSARSRRDRSRARRQDGTGS